MTIDVYKHFSLIQNADLICVDPNDRLLIEFNYDKTVFKANFLNFEIALGLKGKFQIENCLLSLKVVIECLKVCKIEVKDDIIQNTLRTINWKGRMEKYKNPLDGQVVFDGAHNPQKMQSLIDSLIVYFPNRKFEFIVGFKKGKDVQEMLDIIIPHASKIYITEFGYTQDFFIESVKIG